MKTTLLFSLLLCGLVVKSNAQGPYTVAMSNAAYTNLSGATQLTYSAPPDDGYYANGNFTFKVFNRTMSFLPITTPKNSNGGFLAGGGYLAIYETPALDNTIGLQCLYIDSFNVVSGITTAWSKLEGTAGNRIMKVEWRDLVYGTNTASRANFQVWLHEVDGSVSYHYGTNTIPNASSTSAYIGMVVFNASFTALVDQFSLSGALTATPQTTYGSTSLGLPKVNSIPVNGTVITFKKNTSSISSISAEEQIELYPNPAQGSLLINKTNGAVKIYSVTGQIVKELQGTGEEQRIDISKLQSGQYTIIADNKRSIFVVQ